MYKNLLKQGRTKPLQERIGGGVGWGLSGIQRDGNKRIAKKVKTWGEG